MEETSEKRLRFWLAVVIPTVVAVGFTSIAASWIQSYGLTLFVLTPILIGFLSAIIVRPTDGKGIARCVLANLAAVALIGLLIMAFAIEGLVCLIMAVPLAVPLMFLGVLIGFGTVTLVSRPRNTGLAAIILCLVMPLLFGFESAHKTQPIAHEVVSTDEIDAPIAEVWKNVVEFPPIDEQPKGILKLGFAYPMNATIEGRGVGAIRNCNFNTGAFVEPITAWQEPTLLAFDVREQPAPMIETSFYSDLQAAHLTYLRSHRGQFRLYERDGKTVLEGTTIYSHDIAPDVYWRLFSDEIIHQIHMRVLDHIKEVSEKNYNRRAS